MKFSIQDSSLCTMKCIKTGAYKICAVQGDSSQAFGPLLLQHIHVLVA